MPSETNQQIKILIVDDEKYIADILVDTIADKGRSVDVCYDGVSAVGCIENSFYDLIIVDLVMPKVGGLDVLKYAKKANPNVLVIIITGHASIETAVTAIKEGAYDYIRKPFKLDEIRIVVENAVDKIRLNRENRDLLGKLQEAYRELMVCKEEKQDGKPAKLNFFSSNMPKWHYVYNPSSPSDNYVDRLQALSSLRERGSLTEFEFKAFKNHLLNIINTQP